MCSSERSASLTNGMLSSVGQKTDTKIPETITATAGLGTALGIKTAEAVKKVVCGPTARLYPLSAGIPDLDSPLSFPVNSKIVDGDRARQIVSSSSAVSEDCFDE